MNDPKKYKGYFHVKIDAALVDTYLYGTRASVDLYVERHDLTSGAIITPISIGVLDSVGVTMQEAGNYIHGVIESVLHSAVRPPPLGTLEYIPPKNCRRKTEQDREKEAQGLLQCQVCAKWVSSSVNQTCNECAYHPPLF